MGALWAKLPKILRLQLLITTFVRVRRHRPPISFLHFIARVPIWWVRRGSRRSPPAASHPRPRKILWLLCDQARGKQAPPVYSAVTLDAKWPMALESGAGEVASRGRGSIACEIAHGDVANPNHSAALRGILRAILASAQTVRDWEAGPTREPRRRRASPLRRVRPRW